MTWRSSRALLTVFLPSMTVRSSPTALRTRRWMTHGCRNSSLACASSRGPVMLKIEHLNVSIGSIPIIREASLALEEGEMCGLIGRNGAGKTTLLRALMGALPASGKAELDSTDLLQLPAHRRAARGIGYMPEDRRLVPEFSVEENVRLPTWSVTIVGAEQRLAWIYTIMPEVARFRHRR